MRLHRASLELVKDMSLETLFERIVSTACEQAGARYAALGVLDDEGKLKQFVHVGMSEADVKRMAHPPAGLGLLGELMNTEVPIRVPVIGDHPRSVGFPKNLMIKAIGEKLVAGGVSCTRKNLEALFPQGGCRQACRIAGLPDFYCHSC